MFKRWLIILLQSAVTVGLLAFFFHDAEFREQVAHALRNAKPHWLLLGTLFAGIENLLGVFRWRVFLRILHIDLPFWKTVQICLVALFCNTFLLGAAGGDLVRAAYLLRRGASKTDALLSVVMDRISGLGGLAIYTLILTIGHYEWLTSSSGVVPVLGISVMGVFKLIIAYEVGALILLALSLYISTTSFTTNPPKWAPFPAFVTKFGTGYSLLVRQWRASLRSVGISMIMLLMFFAVFYASSQAFDAPITYLQMSTLVPVADIISAMPISIGGIGVRESVFQFLLGSLAGIPAGTAVSISLVGYLLNNSWGLVGAAVLPLFKGIIHEARTRARPLNAEG